MIITYGGSMSHPSLTPSSTATSRGRRLLAAFLAPIALLALAFSISSTTAFGEVGVTQQGNDEEVMDTQSTGIEMPVRPWCGWIALTGANTPIALLPVAGEDETYDGDAIDLAAVGQEYAIKVAPVDQAPESVLASFTQEAEDACSWFASSEVNGVNVKTTLSGNTFTALSDRNTLEVEDFSMDFTTDSIDQNLVIDNTSVTCDADFSFSGSPLTVSDLSSATTGSNVVSMFAIDTLTNSYCSWTSDYTVTIPSELKPTFGNSTYTYTGPTVTNTMVYGRP
jgi:hypothetical protein